MKKGVKKYKLYLDDLLRRYFKLKYGDTPTCCCCGKKIGWYHPKNNPKGMQVGHFQSRVNTVLRWDLRNVHPQCSGCNMYHKFRSTLPYTRFIIAKYGENMIQELEDTIRKYRIIDNDQFYEDTENGLQKLIDAELTRKN